MTPGAIIHSLQSSRGGRFASAFLANIAEDNVSLIAAGIAFYFLMAAFPAIGAAISIYGLVADPVLVADHIDRLGRLLPHDALQILSDQAHKIVSAPGKALSLSFLAGVILAVYSATQGTKALITGCNIAFNVPEKRNFVVLNAVAYGLTLFVVLYFLAALTLVAGLPAIAAIMPERIPVAGLLLWLRWPILLAAAPFGLAVFYYAAPSRPVRHWQWISPGAATATLLWLVCSSLFSLYVSHFGTYNQTYGSLGAVVILLLWFWLSAITILLGAEVNATLEEMGGHKPEHAPNLAEASQPKDV